MSRLLDTEGVKLDFTHDGIGAIADIAAQVNASVENIGARRLQTVMERVLDEISFTATERTGEKIVVDSPMCAARVEDLAKDQDLSRYIL